MVDYKMEYEGERVRDGKNESSVTVKVGVQVVGTLSVIGYKDEAERREMVARKFKRKLSKSPPAEEEHPAMPTSETITTADLDALEAEPE